MTENEFKRLSNSEYRAALRLLDMRLSKRMQNKKELDTPMAKSEFKFLFDTAQVEERFLDSLPGCGPTFDRDYLYYGVRKVVEGLFDNDGNYKWSYRELYVIVHWMLGNDYLTTVEFENLRLWRALNDGTTIEEDLDEALTEIHYFL